MHCQDLKAAATGADISLALALLHMLLSYGRGDLSPSKSEPELPVHNCLNLIER